MTSKRTDRARKRWYAALRDPQAQRGETELEQIDQPDVRCFLGHACDALDSPRTITTVDDIEQVFFGDPIEPFSDIHLPDAVARELDMTRYGQLKTPITMMGRKGVPVEITTIAQMADDTAMTLHEAAAWFEANSDRIAPYGTPEPKPDDDNR